MANVLQKNWQDLIKPTKLEVGSGRQRDKVATMVAEPLERGFGMTLGNALRRVLLSSLQGAAITTVHIDGVLHEFSSIPGVREDVTNIILNIKEIALRMHSEGVKRMVLKKEGPGTGQSLRHRGQLRDRDPEPRARRSARSTRAPRSAWSSRQAWARAMFPPSATARTMRRSA